MADMTPTHPSLDHFAGAPLNALSVEEVRRALRVVSVIATCDLPNDLEDIPDLPDRIRGALGGALERVLQTEDRTTGWLARIPSLHEILFGAGVSLSRRTLSKPFACHIDIIGKTLLIRLVLTGLAASHVKDAEMALRVALQGGIAIKHHSHHRVKVVCRSLDVTWIHGIEAIAVGSEVRLVHRTPMRIRNGNRLTFSRDAVVSALLRRTEDIALWNGCDVASDIARLSILSKDISIAEDRQAVLPWKRYSRSGDGQGQPKLGLTGHLFFRGHLAPFAPVFAIASLFHAGSETAHGFGRVEFWNA
jgi:hypothetical protein